jgi:hypothetical protein
MRLVSLFHECNGLFAIVYKKDENPDLFMGLYRTMFTLLQLTLSYSVVLQVEVVDHLCTLLYPNELMKQ